MANFITVLRIILSIALLFCPALSVPFYVLYILAGITDMIDGPVARKTGTVSEFGSKLDTTADFCFVTVCLVKLVPVLGMDEWIYGWIAVIAVIKVANIIGGYSLKRKMIDVHSVLNKFTGAMLFMLPLMLIFDSMRYSIIIVCIIATLAAIEEGYIVRKGVCVYE